MTGPPEPRAATLLRWAMLALASTGIAGTAAELAFSRHWDTAIQLIPWVVVVVLAGGVLAVAIRPSDRRLRVARVLAVIAGVAGLYGVVNHVSENHHAGPLDAVYGPKWDSMGSASQWWAAATEGSAHQGGEHGEMTRRTSVLIAVAMIAVLGLLAGGVRAVDAYGDWRWTERCVKHHADFCNNDGDGDAGKPWWARNRHAD